jgi:hypothetical protein
VHSASASESDYNTQNNVVEFLPQNHLPHTTVIPERSIPTNITEFHSSTSPTNNSDNLIANTEHCSVCGKSSELLQWNGCVGDEPCLRMYHAECLQSQRTAIPGASISFVCSSNQCLNCQKQNLNINFCVLCNNGWCKECSVIIPTLQWYPRESTSNCKYVVCTSCACHYNEHQLLPNEHQQQRAYNTGGFLLGKKNGRVESSMALQDGIKDPSIETIVLPEIRNDNPLLPSAVSLSIPRSRKRFKDISSDNQVQNNSSKFNKKRMLSRAAVPTTASHVTPIPPKVSSSLFLTQLAQLAQFTPIPTTPVGEGKSMTSSILPESIVSINNPHTSSKHLSSSLLMKSSFSVDAATVVEDECFIVTPLSPMSSEEPSECLPRNNVDARISSVNTPLSNLDGLDSDNCINLLDSDSEFDESSRILSRDNSATPFIVLSDESSIDDVEDDDDTTLHSTPDTILNDVNSPTEIPSRKHDQPLLPTLISPHSTNFTFSRPKLRSIYKLE